MPGAEAVRRNLRARPDRPLPGNRAEAADAADDLRADPDRSVPGDAAAGRHGPLERGELHDLGFGAQREPGPPDPAAWAQRVATLHANTEDGFAEVYIVLREREVNGKLWPEVRVPMKGPATTGWVPRGALDSYNRITTQLVLNRATERIRLYRDGRQLVSFPAGIGTSSTPTPAGHFWIREAFPVRGVAAYGPFAFGTSAYGNVTDWPGGGVVGVHGTDEPQLVPGRPSHGCVRLRNADILRLSRLVPVGTPLLVT